jgi:hypothetical protein
MSPPPAGRHPTALRRLARSLRRRLRPDRGAPPATGPGLGSGEESAIAAAARQEPAATAEPAEREVEPDAPAAEPEQTADGAARIDAARERLRARIEPPEPDAD